MGSEAREHIKKRAQGTSASMKKIGQKDVLEIPFPEIDIGEQCRIVAYLDSIRTKAEGLKRQQEGTQGELDKVIPSSLYKAFRGEL
jgi:type I restriction enzyme S subunit